MQSEEWATRATLSLMFTMFRRAVFGAAIAVTTAAILRIFGGDGTPPQRGGWTEVDPADFD